MQGSSQCAARACKCTRAVSMAACMIVCVLQSAQAQHTLWPAQLPGEVSAAVAALGRVSWNQFTHVHVPSLGLVRVASLTPRPVLLAPAAVTAETSGGRTAAATCSAGRPSPLSLTHLYLTVFLKLTAAASLTSNPTASPAAITCSTTAACGMRRRLTGCSPD